MKSAYKTGTGTSLKNSFLDFIKNEEKEFFESDLVQISKDVFVTYSSPLYVKREWNQKVNPNLNLQKTLETSKRESNDKNLSLYGQKLPSTI